MFVVKVSSVVTEGYSSCCSFFGRWWCLYLWFMLFRSFPLILLNSENQTCLFVECHLCPESLSGCRHSNTHHRTHTCFVEQMVYRALLCPCVWLLCSWSAVGSPLITLIWLGKQFLFNQAVVFPVESPSWTNI